MAYKPIGDYGVIGDLHTVALVGKDGSIDWCCFPNFDSPSMFGALLDDQRGGWFRIAPLEDGKRQQLYLPETNVLLTRFLHQDGVAELTDFMPVECDDPETRPKRHQIVRMLSVVRGRIRFRLECRPAFNFGRDGHEVTLRPQGALFRSSSMALGLVSPIPITISDGAIEAEFTLAAGQQISFFLEHLESTGAEGILDTPQTAETAFHDTIRFWRKWIGQCRYVGRWREMVQRSALTLKLLTYAPSGAIVAAPTTSLPEAVGGVRNWDYRYTWIRDAAFTLYALMRLGFSKEAGRFMQWLDARCHDLNVDGSLQVLYGIDGRRIGPEEVLLDWKGYKASTPVRIGNGAAHQRQLDMYGALMDAAYLYNKHGSPISYDTWIGLSRLVEYVCANWDQPDEGVWEVRGGPRQFVYSKVMCWVALDRGIRLADKRGFPADRAKWMDMRDRIYLDVMCRGWNHELNSFVQEYGSSALDASALVFPLVFFLSPTDPRMQTTLERLRTNLASDALVFRYLPEKAAPDGLPGQEGTFTLCSFWMVEALTRAGRLEEARLLFEKMLSYANHVGLYAEELSVTGEHLGNFPQAFAHIGLISAAYNLDRALSSSRTVAV
ncbi:MAG: glycoside hydrolase family 15 protein [Nitrospira sp.]|nr:glycoside hydrolase family 15 protein [Nitrospira sp.]MDH4369211.1 glycoside hydrolase family 15 protein [Nitrospira sp.]MDH5347998.1 glycoside hydrolase family 15 protein [Nitrospira sp.]MDH5496661.1 glycoside hydrolase family 15 protein [Nitrospira sp.]